MCVVWCGVVPCCALYSDCVVLGCGGSCLFFVEYFVVCRLTILRVFCAVCVLNVLVCQEVFWVWELYGLDRTPAPSSEEVIGPCTP